MEVRHEPQHGVNRQMVRYKSISVGEHVFLCPPKSLSFTEEIKHKPMYYQKNAPARSSRQEHRRSIPLNHVPLPRKGLGEDNGGDGVFG